MSGILYETTLHRYIQTDPAICDGKPIISGTRIRVAQIAIEYDRLGWTPDQIVEAHPHLTLAQVHDALSYYYENRDALDADIAAAQELVASLRELYPSKVVLS
jgi:uncharacterized protein (DUF433 family)